jgi:hypothetical protein
MQPLCCAFTPDTVRCGRREVASPGRAAGPSQESRGWAPFGTRFQPLKEREGGAFSSQERGRERERRLQRYRSARAAFSITLGKPLPFLRLAERFGLSWVLAW